MREELERTNMQAVLLRAAIDESSAESWRLLSLVLPELRTADPRRKSAAPAHTLLTDDLPRFYSASYWDLNKQILLSLSKLYRVRRTRAYYTNLVFHLRRRDWLRLGKNVTSEIL